MTLREQLQAREETMLSPLACRSSQSRGRARPEEGIIPARYESFNTRQIRF